MAPVAGASWRSARPATRKHAVRVGQVRAQYRDQAQYLSHPLPERGHRPACRRRIGDAKRACRPAGRCDDCAGVLFITTSGYVGRLGSNSPSSGDSGALAGANLVSVAPDGGKSHIGNFGATHLWTFKSAGTPASATQGDAGRNRPPGISLANSQGRCSLRTT